ncbi:unnamed protein product [Pleuronectes platessa]|uniref:Uncharacterized protein n=1 Tax=Pleuronectes platessa TaxID=8262 RepID=A0A9N7VCT6_PLEPL|nr:unnamed protein product [Pleuronectes platessa]
MKQSNRAGPSAWNHQSSSLIAPGVPSTARSHHGPAGGGGCGGSRCSRFEWQVVIYADLCSRSEPPDKSITSYYSEPESKRPSAETGDFILYQFKTRSISQLAYGCEPLQAMMRHFWP